MITIKPNCSPILILYELGHFTFLAYKPIELYLLYLIIVPRVSTESWTIKSANAAKKTLVGSACEFKLSIFITQKYLYYNHALAK